MLSLLNITVSNNNDSEGIKLISSQCPISILTENVRKPLVF